MAVIRFHECAREAAKAIPPNIQNGAVRTRNGTGRRAQMTSEHKAISDNVMQGHTMLAGGNCPRNACTIMSIANEAAYAPMPTTTNVTAMKIDRHERSRKSSRAFKRKAATPIAAQINRKVLIVAHIFSALDGLRRSNSRGWSPPDTTSQIEG